MDFCPLCNLIVAPRARFGNESDRIVVNKVIMHKSCLIKHQLSVRDIEEIASKPKPIKRMWRLPFRNVRKGGSNGARR